MADYNLPPGPLSAYLGVRDSNARMGMQRQSADLQQASGMVGILAHIQQQKQLQAAQQQQSALRDVLSQNGGNMETLLPQLMKSPEGIALAGHLAPLLKQQQDAKMAEQFSNTDKMSTDQIDALAQNLALRGHPNAAAMMSVADRRRAQEQQKTAMTGMQSAPERPAIAANTLPPDLAGPPSPDVPAQPAKAGVADFLVNSPFPMVSMAAKNLQARINQGDSGLTPAMVDSQLNRLTAMHQSEQSKIDASKRQLSNTIVIKDMYPKAPAGGGNAAGPTGDYSKQGDDYLKSLPQSDQQIVKKIANYDIDPKTLSTKGGHRERILSMVSQFDPTYDDTQYANKRKAISQFGSGPQGNTVRSLNVAIEHIDTLKRAADALKNGDFTPANKVYNEVATIFGKTPPNTFEGIRDIVANEVLKGTIGNAGAQQDREAMAAKVKAQSSPKQLSELFNGWTELMGGQVKGLERQYQASTLNKDFRERYLTPATRDAIATAESKAAAPTRRASDQPGAVKKYNPATGKIE